MESALDRVQKLDFYAHNLRSIRNVLTRLMEHCVFATLLGGIWASKFGSQAMNAEAGFTPSDMKGALGSIIDD